MTPEAPTDSRPSPPEKPAPDDCCGGGCLPCVFDAYEDALERHRVQLAAWQARQRDGADSDA